MAEYRIVRDNYCGYEVQIRRWWWPFWVEAGFCNTHTSIEKAEAWAHNREQPCVKYLGKITSADAATRQTGEPDPVLADLRSGEDATEGNIKST